MVTMGRKGLKIGIFMVAHSPFCFGANPLDLEGVAFVGWMWLLLPLRKTCQKGGDDTNNPNNPTKPGGCGSEELGAQKEGSGRSQTLLQHQRPSQELLDKKQKKRINVGLKHKTSPQTPQLLPLRAVSEDAL